MKEKVRKTKGEDGGLEENEGLTVRKRHIQKKTEGGEDEETK